MTDRAFRFTIFALFGSSFRLQKHSEGIGVLSRLAIASDDRRVGSRMTLGAKKLSRAWSSHPPADSDWLL
jgi:hypothetical protein